MSAAQNHSSVGTGVAKVMSAYLGGRETALRGEDYVSALHRRMLALYVLVDVPTKVKSFLSKPPLP